jgi:hypothetical protein
MRIPQNVILIWTGLNSNIPSGWTRETSLDDKFPKAWGAENPNTTGGADTHTHTSPAHSHTLSAHTHTYTLAAVSSSSGMDTSVQNYGIIDSHTHTGTSGALSGGTTSSDAVTYGPASNDPPHRKVIFIKASIGALLATDMVALFNSNTPPPNWSNVSELQGRYFKGATTGADADLTTNNGSTTNLHNITHTHTATTHSHVAANSGTGSPQTKSKDPASSVQSDHVHSVTLNASTQNINQNTDTLTTVETVEPAYTILQAIKKGASGIKEKGIIGLWLGATANIPRGWVLCDGTNGTKDLRDRFIKIGDPAGANGGSNTHTHSAQAHSHTGSGTHSHTGSASAHVNGSGSGASNTTHLSVAGSVHSVTNVSAPTVNYNSANTTADSSPNQPSYRTVAYIQFQEEIYGGGMLLNFL